MGSFRVYLRRFTVVGSIHLVSAAVAFFSVALFTRASSIESFASYYLVISIINVIVFPIMQSVINKTVTGENTKSDILLAGTFIAGIVVYYGFNYEIIIAQNSSSLITSLLAITLCIFGSGYAEGHARKHLNFQLIATSRAVGLSVNVLCVCVSYYLDNIELINLIYFRSLEYMGQTLLYFFKVGKNNFGIADGTPNQGQWSFYYLFSLILLYSLVNFDKIVLKYLGVSESLLGMYSLYFFSAFVITGKIYDFLNAIFFSDIVSIKVGLDGYTQLIRVLVMAIVALFCSSFILSVLILWFLGQESLEFGLITLLASSATFCFVSQGLWLYMYGIDVGYRLQSFRALAFSFVVMLVLVSFFGTQDNILYWAVAPLGANFMMFIIGLYLSRSLKF